MLLTSGGSHFRKSDVLDVLCAAVTRGLPVGSAIRATLHLARAKERDVSRPLFPFGGSPRSPPLSLPDEECKKGVEEKALSLSPCLSLVEGQVPLM